MNVSGENMHIVQFPQLIIWANGNSYFGVSNWHVASAVLFVITYNCWCNFVNMKL